MDKCVTFVPETRKNHFPHQRDKIAFYSKIIINYLVMAIRIRLEKTAKPLFCESKWWGDPDLPADAEYPMMTVCENPDGSTRIVRANDNVSGCETYEYPLTFICQVRCEDIAELDTGNLLPHEGMLYFFAAMDEFTGYDSPVHLQAGEWPKGSVVVKYSKTINMETFQACIMVDEDDQPLTDPVLEMSFEACEDNAGGLKLLGNSVSDTVNADFAGYKNLLQIGDDEVADIHFPEAGILNFLVSEADLAKGLLKRPVAVLSAEQ